ncbi:GlxA family transcriptional regulator [Paenirhodobacter sp.]|uniref:GlxA family transcriptional regulator n=1 Tax=Paenirhodobacter sp. TaxID=1965326 RepID=UPI003B3DF7A2
MTARCDSRFVAPGAAHVPVPEGAAQVVVTFVLVPRFTLLAFTSALEPFRVANQLAGRALFRWNICTQDGKPVESSSGVPVTPDAPLPAEAEPGCVLICGGVTPETTMRPALGSWIRTQWRRGRTVGGLCTGAYALARGGILEGRRFTLHWENIPGFRETFPDLDPLRQVFCLDDRIITCAGGVAGADLALNLISTHFGTRLAQAVMEMCLLSSSRREGEGQFTSLAARLATRNPAVVRAAEYIEAEVENGFDLEGCARHAGVTRRQIQRLFRQHLGVTPQQYAADLRLQRGRMLLAETNMSVMDVAIACGYSSRSAFSKGFRAKFGSSPQAFTSFAQERRGRG